MRSTAGGMRSTSLVRLARVGLAKAVRPPGARKITVLRVRLALKPLPRMVSVAPTLARIGETFVMPGPFFGVAAGGHRRRPAAAAL